MSPKRKLRKPAALTTLVAMAAAAALLVPTASSASGASSLPSLQLTLSKNTVTVGGSLKSGAVNVVISVKGEATDSPTLILLKPGISFAQFRAAISAFGESTPFDAIDPYGTIVYSGTGYEGSVASAQAVLPAGNYAVLSNGSGHAFFTVAQSEVPAALQAPQATIRAIDFRFRGATTLHDGELVRFENDGYLIHMFAWGKAKSPADAKLAEAALLAGKPKAAKAYATGLGQFVGPLSHGEMQQQVIHEAPGTYVLFCAMNAEDGRDHYQLGMLRTITIVK